MNVIADLHIHSRYSRACSRDLVPEHLAVWADKKGITVMGTGDFTHPAWLSELEQNLRETEPGLFRLGTSASQCRFMLSSEVSSIYKKGDKVRRVHNLLFAPSFAAVHTLIERLEKRGANLKADGRPIMGIPCDELLDMCKDADPGIELVPAHAWTPHFGVFGSLSGFDSLEEAFGSQAKHIFAIETGLSSDPMMNWQVSHLDNIALISNSDAHSLRKLGREANVFELNQSKFSYQGIMDAIRSKDPATFLRTIEFFPEEGKYHLDGHRDHEFSATPEQTKKLQGICPICGKKLLLGVMHRVADLGDRDHGTVPPHSIPFVNAIPLEEIIAEALGVGVSSKKVLAEYERIVAQHPEFDVLLELSEPELEKTAGPVLSQSIMRVRRGEVHITPGYDGVFGKISIYSEQEREQLSLKPKQGSLF